MTFLGFVLIFLLVINPFMWPYIYGMYLLTKEYDF